MRCPNCNSDKLSVVETRGDDSSIRRRRQCQDCEHRFSTYERVEYALPMIIKKDDRREVFKAQKLRAGIIRACEKRPVSMDQIDSVVTEIEKEISESARKEVPSVDVGELLMAKLKELDKVAYVRFASVYKEFSDIRQFLDTLEGLEE